MSENTVEETSAPVMFTLNFSEEELNKILNIIAQLPYSSVFTLINNIQAQAQAQIQARTTA
jgi:hypothetical protein